MTLGRGRRLCAGRCRVGPCPRDRRRLTAEGPPGLYSRWDQLPPGRRGRGMATTTQTAGSSVVGQFDCDAEESRGPRGGVTRLRAGPPDARNHPGRRGGRGRSRLDRRGDRGPPGQPPEIVTFKLTHYPPQASLEVLDNPPVDARGHGRLLSGPMIPVACRPHRDPRPIWDQGRADWTARILWGDTTEVACELGRRRNPENALHELRIR